MGFVEYLLGFHVYHFNRSVDTGTGGAHVQRFHQMLSTYRYLAISEVNKLDTVNYLENSPTDTPNVTSDNDQTATLYSSKDMPNVTSDGGQTATLYPWWNKKKPDIEFSETEKEICFVHVGKTAGSTLALYFGFNYPECENALSETLGDTPVAPGLLAAATTHMFHTEYNDCADKVFDYHLFVLRDPLTRILSWFNYEHPDTGYWDEDRSLKQDLLYKKCDFDTLNILGETGLAPRQTSNISDVCRGRARDAITGAVGFSTHNYYNYEYYLREVTTDAVPNIVVIRTEHLAADWKSIEEDILHGPKDQNVTFSRRCNSSPQRPDNMYLSPTAKRRICEALCQEIQVYKNLLHAAINLSEGDVAQSIAELYENCPVEATNTNVCVLSY